MSKPFVIVTDSTTDLPIDVIKKYQIHVMPLSFHIGDQTYENVCENPKISSKEFYDQLKKGALPTTSQLNPMDYEKHLTPFLERKEDVLIISFSSALSGTYNSGRIAVDELKEKYSNQKIEIIDSKSASLGEGLLVYLAALEREKGKSFDEVKNFVIETGPQISHWFTVTDISHLKRGGRISAVKSFVASTFNIKPIMHVNYEGRLVPRQKAIGRNKSLKVLVEKMVELALPIKQIVFIGHGNDLEAAETVKEHVLKHFSDAEVMIGEIGPVIGAHAGNGVIALFFQGKQR